MIIKLITIKNDLLKTLRKFLKFKEILKIFEKFEKIVQILKKFLKISLLAYYFQIIFLTNFDTGKIEGHVLPQSTAAKNWGGDVLPRLPGAPMIKPPPRFQRLTSPMIIEQKCFLYTKLMRIKSCYLDLLINQHREN